MTSAISSAVRSKALKYLAINLHKNYPNLWKASDSRVSSFLENYVKIANTRKRGILQRGANNVATDFVKIFGVAQNLAASFANEFLRGVKAGEIDSAIENPVAAARSVASRNVAVRTENAIRAAENPTILDRLTTTAGSVGTSYATALKFLPWIAIGGVGLWAYVTFLAPAGRVAQAIRR